MNNVNMAGKIYITNFVEFNVLWNIILYLFSLVLTNINLSLISEKKIKFKYLLYKTYIGTKIKNVLIYLLRDYKINNIINMQFILFNCKVIVNKAIIMSSFYTVYTKKQHLDKK